MESNTKELELVFEDDMPYEKIAEFIEILSQLSGEDLDVVSFHDAPPQSRLKKAV